MDRTLVVRVDVEIEEGLALVAKERDISKSEVVRRVLAAFLKQNGKKS